MGFDVYRRTAADCGDPVRVNDTPYPRGLPNYMHVDEPPAEEILYEYKVVFVDDQRKPVDPNYPEWAFCDPCSQESWASCPEFSAPLVHGEVRDNLIWLRVDPNCPGTCLLRHLPHRSMARGAERLRG